ncbi:MAG: GNAT family N-acetyltransferase [Solirubrobacterales bacterium]|nr:GNAT family N-acetyltransferase [Solirubrobacterales bacterium]
MTGAGGRIEIRPLDPFEIRAFSHFAASVDLTYLVPPVALAVGVEADGKPAGLALGYFVRASAVRVAALVVDESLRGLGIGKQLYERLIEELLKRGVQLVDVLASNPAPFLERRGWKLGARLASVYTFSKRVGEAPWLQAAIALPPQYELVPWLHHTKEDRRKAMRLMEDDPVARRLDPFHDPSRVFGPSSNALRQDGELVGWCVTHRISQQTLQYSSVYVAAKQRRTVAPMILLNYSIREHLRRFEEVPFGIQAVPPELPEIERFANKRLAPWADRVQRVHIWWKQFDAPEAGTA